MTSSKKKYIGLILSALASALLLSTCGTEPGTNLDSVSDAAKDSDTNILDGRGEDPATDDPAKDPPAPLKPEPIIPEFDDDEDDSKDFDPNDTESGCGDGEREPEEEECDDGNRINGDGCNANCRSEAVVVASARTSLDVGYAHVCLLDQPTLQVKCWGLNDYGQLGQGNTAEIGDGVGVAVSAASPIDIGNGISVELVSAGGDSTSGSTCVITNKNDVKCFGDNAAGQLGKGSTADLGDGANEMGSNLSIINLGTSLEAVDIDSGAQHQCALLDNDDVKCWGLNDAGQLGQGNTDSLGDGAGEMGDALAIVPLGVDVKAVALGAKHSCVITAADAVRCWGSNASGQLGVDSTDNLGDGAGEVAALANINLGTTATAVAAGENHTCALLTGGTVKCWGENGSGQLGQGSTDDLGDGVGEMAALAAIDLGAGRTATAIAAGDNYSCALLDNDTVKCWGANASGQLGQDSADSLGDGGGEMGDALAAINLGAGRTAVAIAAGGSTTCAVLDNDAVKCWGENASGQLGQGSTADLGDGAGEMAALNGITTGF